MLFDGAQWRNDGFFPGSCGLWYAMLSDGGETLDSRQ